MRVLGIDPASQAGAALVVDGDLRETWVWKKDKRKSDAFNLYSYFIQLIKLINNTTPDMACVESLSVERNAKTTRVVSHYQAASVLACKEEGLMVIEARVSSARREALGDGSMNKDDAFAAIKDMFGEHKFKVKKFGGYDEADAVVLALAGPGLAEKK